jgi:hypothetical protein
MLLQPVPAVAILCTMGRTTSNVPPGTTTHHQQHYHTTSYHAYNPDKIGTLYTQWDHQRHNEMSSRNGTRW